MGASPPAAMPPFDEKDDVIMAVRRSVNTAASPAAIGEGAAAGAAPGSPTSGAGAGVAPVHEDFGTAWTSWLPSVPFLSTLRNYIMQRARTRRKTCAGMPTSPTSPRKCLRAYCRALKLRLRLVARSRSPNRPTDRGRDRGGAFLRIPHQGCSKGLHPYHGCPRLCFGVPCVRPRGRDHAFLSSRVQVAVLGPVCCPQLF